MTRLVYLAVFVAMSLAPAATQIRDGARVVVATGTGQIAGRVVSGHETPVPLRRATVTLIAERDGTRLTAVTDDAGAFAFTSLPADRYALSAAKNGYVPMAYGSKRPGGSGTPVVVADDQEATTVINLPRGSVITGTVRDEFGRPAPDVTVAVLRFVVSLQTGGRTLQSVRIGSAGQQVSGYSPDGFPGTAMTDDRGVYRIYGLAAGEYVVSATLRPRGGGPMAVTDVHQITDADVTRARQLLREPSAGAAVGGAAPGTGTAGSTRVDFAPMYHPAAIARDEAATILLGAGEERSGIDVMLRPVPTASVAGVLSRPDGTPQSGAQVSVMDPLSSSGGVFKSTRSGFDGEFVIGGVPPGRYLVQSVTYPEGLSAAAEVVMVGRDVPLSLVLAPPMTVSGRIVFDGTSEAPDFNTVQLWLGRRPQPIFGGPGLDRTPDGRFVFPRVPTGTYTLRINGRPPAGWALRSVMLGDIDVSDIPFEIAPNQHIEGIVMTLTDRPAEISGTLQTESGEPAPEYTLVVFSADPRYWVAGTRRTRHVRPDVQGRYIAGDLPAGDYLIAAVTDLEDGQWNDPALLAELAASGPIKITVVEGDRKVQDIRISARD